MANKTFREALKDHYKLHGIPHPVRHLARFCDASTTAVYGWLKDADHGVGYEQGYLHPIRASQIIAATDSVMDNPNGRNTIRQYLKAEIRENEKRMMRRFKNED